jgi:hypothetical protein
MNRSDVIRFETVEDVVFVSESQFATERLRTVHNTYLTKEAASHGLTGPIILFFNQIVY